MWIETCNERWIRSDTIIGAYINSQYDGLYVITPALDDDYEIVRNPTDDALPKFLNLISSAIKMIYQSDLAPIRRNRETQNL